MKSLAICLFSESATTSDGYRQGYVSFAHLLLYLTYVLGAQKACLIEMVLLSTLTMR